MPRTWADAWNRGSRGMAKNQSLCPSKAKKENSYINLESDINNYNRLAVFETSAKKVTEPKINIKTK